MAEGMLSLSWNNHSTTFCNALASLKEKDRYADATITCQGKFYPVHKLVLSTCSQYFEKIFEHTLCKHPVIVLNIQSADLEAILSYMYDGAVNVDQTNLSQLIKVAELLQIKGLAVPDEPPTIPTSPPSSFRATHRRQAQWSNYGRYSLSPRRKGSPETNTSSFPSKRFRREEEIDPHEESSHGQTPDTPQVSKSSFEESTDGALVKVEERTKTGTPVNNTECELEIKEERMDPNKESEGEDLDGNYENESELNQTPADESTEMVVMPLDQTSNTTNTNNSTHQQTLLEYPLHHQALTSQDTLPHDPSDPATTVPGPSDMEQWFGDDDIAGVPKSSILPFGLPQDTHKQIEKVQEFGPEGREVVSPKIHLCPYCKYSTWKKINLTKHLRIHTRDRPHSCPYCQAKFSRKQCLNRHIQTHTGEKSFGCTHCPYRAIRKQSLLAHVATHHKHDR